MKNIIQNVFFGCFRGTSSANIYQALSTSGTPVERIESGPEIGNSIGVVRVVLQIANIKQTMFSTPRPFARIYLRSNPKEYQTTQTLEERTLSPNWISESTDLLVYSLQDILEFQIMRQHRVFKPSVIGLATLNLGILDVEPSLVGIERPIRDINHEMLKLKGTILFDVFFYPASPSSNSELSVTSEPQMTAPNAGIVTLNIQNATDFTWDDHHPKPSKLTATVSLGWTGVPIHTSSASIYADQMLVWNSAFDFICFDKSETTIVIKIVDKQSVYGSKSPSIYAHVSIALDELILSQLDEKETDMDMWPLSGCPHGRLTMSAQWKPVDRLKSRRLYTGDM